VEVSPRESAIAPVEIDGLPGAIGALGRRWQRKAEFHMTVLGTAAIEEIGAGDRAAWKRVARVLAGRSVAPIRATRELRRVRHPDEPGFETIAVMVESPALVEVYRDLSTELRMELAPLPAHVTLYSTDPERGIGINDEAQLRERAPALSEEEQQELRRALRFDEVFGPAAQQ
jgi:hypothetical protein